MEVSALRSDLQSSRVRLFDAIRGLTEEQFRFTPAGEEWAIASHLAHLLRVERIFVERARSALTEHEPPIASTGVSNDADPGLAQRLAVPQIIHGILNARRELDDLLASCDEASLQRAIIHERIGRMSIEQIATKMTEHEVEHAVEVVRLARIAPSAGRVVLPLVQHRSA